MLKNTGFIKGLALALMMGFGLSLAQPKEAKAYLLITVALDDYGPIHAVENRPLATLLCLVFLPTCILDEKAAANASVASQELMANGYTAGEAAQIVADNHAFLAELSARHEKLVITKDDNKETAEQGIRSVLPTASAVFVDYAADQALATAQ